MTAIENGEARTDARPAIAEAWYCRWGTRLAVAAAAVGYAAVVAFAIRHHEPWTDEAQAWLLARDLKLPDLIFQMHAEGTPPLWHFILWIATHLFHLPYSALSWIGAGCAFAGCVWFLRFSPFPLVIRMAFPFTYFILFQYGVVARQYVLLPLFAFAAAHYYPQADHKPWRWATALSALSLLSVQGVVIAVTLAMARGLETYREWHQLKEHHISIFQGALLASLVLFLVFTTIWPSTNLFMMLRPADDPTHGIGVLGRAISQAFVGNRVLSVAFLLIVAGWTLFRRKPLVLILPVVSLLVFFVMIYFSPWHSGFLTITVVTAVWITWPGSVERDSGSMKWLTRGIAVVFLVFCAVQIKWTYDTIRLDYRGPYSGSADAAVFLKQAGARTDNTCGVDYSSIAVQPYFDRNIFLNYGGPEAHTFWDWRGVTPQCNGRVEWIVVGLPATVPESLSEAWYARRLTDKGFFLVHRSPGEMYFEGKRLETGTYLIYHRP